MLLPRSLLRRDQVPERGPVKRRKEKVMNNSKSNKFIVFYTIPAAVMANWKNSDPNVRSTAEEKMKGEWQKWMTEHAKIVRGTEACGKTKQVAAGGISDTKNDICLYSFVEAESHEAAAKIFEKHPHLQIPQSTIEVMAVRPM